MAKAIRDVNHILKHSKIFSYLKVLKDDTIANIKPFLPLPVLDLKSKYIPLSAGTLIRLTGENSNYIKCSEDQKLFNDLSYNLYQIICYQFDQKYLEIKENLQTKDGNLPKTCEITNLDRDYWLVQQISDLAITANLIELPQSYISIALSKPLSIKDYGISATVNVKAFDILRIWTTSPSANGLWGVGAMFNLTFIKNYAGKIFKTPESRDFLDHVTSNQVIVSESSLGSMLVVSRKSPWHPLVYQLLPASDPIDLLLTLSPELRFEPSSGRKFLAASLGLASAGGLFFNAFSTFLHLPIYANDVLAIASAVWAYKIWRVNSLRDALRFLLSHLSTPSPTPPAQLIDDLYRIVLLAAREKFCEMALCYFTLSMIATRTLPVNVPPPSELNSDYISPGYLELCVEAYIIHMLTFLPNTPGRAKIENPSIEFDSRASLDWLCREGLVIQSEAPIFEESIHGYKPLSLSEGLKILISLQKNQPMKNLAPFSRDAFTWFDHTSDDWVPRPQSLPKWKNYVRNV